jgi:hypothetical protein
MTEKASVLVVANRTAGSDELRDALRRRTQRGPAAFTLLVPATPRGVAWAADMHSGVDEAERNAAAAAERLRQEGFEIEARVGDADPVAAVEDAINFGDFDEVIVSTLPHHLSKWLKLDLPHRVDRVTGLPVTHVEASEATLEVG